MTAKGQARGPNHFIDPPTIAVGQPPGIEVTRRTGRIGKPKRWERIADALVTNLGEWAHCTTYPLKPGKDILTVAQHTVDRLNRVGLPLREYQMLIVRRHILKVLGADALNDWHVEAKIFQQQDGSVQVWARYTENVAAA